MKIIIVGASGYLGRKIFAKATELGKAIGTSTTGSFSLVQLDLSEADRFDYTILESGDLVLLAAAISSPDICAKEHQRAWLANVAGTSIFIDRALAAGARVAFFSSDTVYGEKDKTFGEEESCSPLGEYAIMKHEIEQRYLGIEGFKTLRLSYIFSAEDKFTKYLLQCARSVVTAEIFAPFDRAVIYRDDVVEASLNLAKQWNQINSQVINFAGPSVVSRVDFAKTIIQAAGLSLDLKIIEPEPEFFAKRPHIINMTSTHLPSLLNRKPLSLAEAANIEFSSERK